MNKFMNFFESGEGQHELERKIKNRKLYRPRTSKFSVVFLYLIFLFGLLVIPFLILLNIDIVLKVILIILYILLDIEMLLRLSFIKTIRCYQHYAKEETRRRCLCIPSCSEYAIDCYKKFPLIYFFYKIHKRLFKTCRGGMYLIDKP